MSADDLVHDPTRKADEDDDPFRRVRLEKLAALRGMGVEPYPVSFARTAEAAELDARHADLPAGAETEDRVRVAGRIRAMRNSGMFIDLHDASGKIQIFCHRDFLGSEALGGVRLLDIGELIGFYGLVRPTPRGHLSTNAPHVPFPTNALRPP